ncbi:hypothetical protein SAMN02983003_0256 [Devosia enhydra]|uniref:Uncharacterized protein n=1 Tax=Devosia enhydra TaxID=665118 RepID=A0A1K2HSS6_9HYPH|nr:hypothetical protein [Devosia enhydra]SFZ81002.1 hypothetical protein SAMN02983003_0256 [Devosia enhydra]
MWDFSIPRSLSLMGQTLPFILFRIIVYAGIAIAYVLVTGVGAGIGWGVGAFGDADFQGASTFWGGAIGLGLTAGALYFAREYILYIVKAGHIAVMVELLDGGSVPQGRDQISHATEVVKARFAETHVLFALDQLVKGVLGAIIGLIQGITAILPIPGLQNIVGLVRAFLRIALGLVDEIILAYAIRTRSTNPWESAQTALVLYTQNYKTMLRNAAWLTLITWGLSLVVFLVMLAPAAAIVALIPNAWSAGGLVFALIFAWAVKAALIEPFALACLMQAYFRTIEGQAPDPAWHSRISSVSGKFRQLGERAVGWVGARRPSGFSTVRPGGATQ